MHTQINFYLTENDIAKIFQYLEDKQWLWLSDLESKPAQITEKNMMSKGFLVPKNCLNELVFENNLHANTQIDFLRSPIIEWKASIFKEKKAELNKGRLFFKAEFYENDIKKTKSELFLKEVKKLFAWFKKQYKIFPHTDLAWAYTSPQVLDHFEKQNLKMMMNKTDKLSTFIDKNGYHEI